MTASAEAGPKAGLTHIQLFADTEGAPVRWRLLGGNNRELGRGIEQFQDLDSCRRGIDNLRLVLGELESTVQRSGPSTWMWRLVRGGEVVATSAHRYDRLIRCRLGLAHFMTHLATCEVGPGLMLTQARRWPATSRTDVVPSSGARR